MEIFLVPHKAGKDCKKGFVFYDKAGEVKHVQKQLLHSESLSTLI